MKVTENVKRLLLHFTFCRVQNRRCILLFVVTVSLPCFFSPQGFSPHQIAKMSVSNMSVHATSTCLSNSCARRKKMSQQLFRCHNKPTWCLFVAAKVTFVWTICLVPTNVALMESLFLLLAEFCKADKEAKIRNSSDYFTFTFFQRSINKKQQWWVLSILSLISLRPLLTAHRTVLKANNVQYDNRLQDRFLTVPPKNDLILKS